MSDQANLIPAADEPEEVDSVSKAMWIGMAFIAALGAGVLAWASLLPAGVAE